MGDNDEDWAITGTDVGTTDPIDWLQRLLDNTASGHPDFALLHQAEKTIHELALRINSVKESKHEEDLLETLKKLELLLLTDVGVNQTITYLLT